MVRNKLDSNEYNYDEIFFNGNDKLPRWSGYSLGYYLVKKYLEKTNKRSPILSATPVAPIIPITFPAIMQAIATDRAEMV